MMDESLRLKRNESGYMTMFLSKKQTTKRNPEALVFYLVLVVFILMGLSGCYSFSASSMPPHIRSIYIHDIRNSTTNPILTEKVRQGIRELFRKNASGVRLLNEPGDADLEITLKRYSNTPDNYNRAGSVQTYRVTILADVLFKDNVKDRIIYEGRNLNAAGIYDVSINESEEIHGQGRAVEQLQQLIINNALSDW